MDTLELHKVAANPAIPHSKAKPGIGIGMTFFFIGFAAFVVGMALEQGVIGGIGFAVMATAIVFMNTALWAKVANSKSLRYFRSISTVIRRQAEENKE